MHQILKFCLHVFGSTQANILPLKHLYPVVSNLLLIPLYNCINCLIASNHDDPASLFYESIDLYASCI